MIYIITDITGGETPSPAWQSILGDVKGIALTEEDARRQYEALKNEQQSIVVYCFNPKVMSLYSMEGGGEVIAAIYLEGPVPTKTTSYNKMYKPQVW